MQLVTQHVQTRTEAWAVVGEVIKRAPSTVALRTEHRERKTAEHPADFILWSDGVLVAHVTYEVDDTCN